jgi:hypothetical protein
MHALVLQEPFFAPVEGRVIQGLIEQYDAERARIDRVAAMVRTDARSAVAYFLSGNHREGRVTPNVDEVFEVAGAVKALNSDYWKRALDLTLVLDLMPQKRRDSWFDAIHKMTTPEFTMASVMPTLEELLSSRAQYFGERVDGLFQSLSGAHVTNRPEGFCQRMILASVFSDWGSPDSSRCGYIGDLRCVVAKFMGRSEPKWNATHSDLRRLRETPGKWHVMDGGSLRIRVYKCGTAHIEISESVAHRLNAVLHWMHPQAIPARFRQPNKKRTKSFAVMQRALPFPVLEVLRDMRVNDRSTSPGTVWTFGFNSNEDKRVRAEADQVLAALGGVAEGRNEVHFDFDARTVINDVILSGCVPDKRSHQYYPTPAAVAALVLEAAEIDVGHQCLEPSAGQGALASRMPRGRTLCVELSELHCRVLRAKGHRVVQGDFLEWAQASAESFDRICMNPPFADGRARMHAEAAARHLRTGGRLVAVLPASMRGKTLMEGWTHTWSDAIASEFADTSVSVVLLTLVRP